MTGRFSFVNRKLLFRSLLVEQQIPTRKFHRRIFFYEIKMPQLRMINRNLTIEFRSLAMDEYPFRDLSRPRRHPHLITD